MTTDRDDVRRLLDDNGFLADPRRWDGEMAVRIAEELEIGPLGAVHWRVIQHLRELHLDHGDLPLERRVCREFELDPGCITRLFGGLIEAWKIAGLPDPGEEARVYMENMETFDSITEPASAQDAKQGSA
jgi:tRNA 2-thiouridine synthesizing protein E